MQIAIDNELAERLKRCRETLTAPSSAWLARLAIEALVEYCEQNGHHLVVPFHIVAGEPEISGPTNILQFPTGDRIPA